MRYVVVALSLINGLWMLIDGIYVTLNGKYIGPERPGPWASLIGLTGLDVFKLGPLFVVFGLAWVVFAGGFVFEKSWAWAFGILLSIATLWYLPFGTLISIVVLVVLLVSLKS